MTDLRQVFDDLVRFETILWGAIDGRLQEERGISLASLNCMLVIDATPLCRVHDIARAVAITVGGASQAVDRLESAGLCARRANPSDRRSSIVELTPEGTELLRVAAPVFDVRGCCGAIGVSYLAQEDAPATEVCGAVVAAARRASTELGGHWSAGEAPLQGAQ